MMRALLASTFALMLLISGTAYGDGKAALQAEIRQDETLIHDCIRASIGFDDAVECVGRVSEACIERTRTAKSGISRVEQYSCAWRELRFWKQVYLDEFRKMLTFAEREEEEGLFLGSVSGAGAHDVLIRTEGLWQQFVSAQCEFENARFGTGNMGMTATPHCQSRLFVSRILYLRSLDWLQRVSASIQPIGTEE